MRLMLVAVVASLLIGCGGEQQTEQDDMANATVFPVENVGVRRGYVNSRFGQMHVRAVKPLEQNDLQPPLIALHLAPNSGQVFSSFLPLIGEDRLAIAPDYPGYGMSDPIFGEQSIEDYAAAIWDVVGSMVPTGEVDLLGYHTGAAVALEMARTKPDRIRRMVLVSVPVLAGSERRSGAALPFIRFDQGGNFARSEWRRSWRWRGPGQSVESVLATYAETMRPGARERGVNAVLAYDVAAALKAATQHPTMIVRVRDDLWAATLRARKLRPQAEYVEYPDRGHGLFHAAPKVLNTQIRAFLDQ